MMKQYLTAVLVYKRIKIYSLYSLASLHRKIISRFMMLFGISHFVLILMLFSCNNKQELADKAPHIKPVEPVESVHENIYTDKLLSRVKNLLNQYNHEVHYLYINNMYTISIWIMLDELETAPKQPDIKKNTEFAYASANKIIIEILVAVPEIKKHFDIINPMIVDKNYNSWYIDFVILNDNPEYSLYSDFLATAYKRQKQPPNQDYSDWSQKTKKNLKIILKTRSKHPNYAAYLLTERDNYTIQLFIPLRNPKTRIRIYEIIEKLYLEIKKMNNQVHLVEIYFINQAGRVIIFSRIDAAVLYSKNWQSKYKDKIIHSNHPQFN